MVQLIPNWKQLDATSQLSSQQWDAEARPALRLLWIGLLMLLPVSGMLIRLSLLKQLPEDNFPILADQQYVHEELITASDGRILSSDGIVLAQDQKRFDLLVEYRWLETPLNRLWKRRLARRLLKSESNKYPSITQAELSIDQQQQQLWATLDQLCQTYQSKSFEEIRSAIQLRVEKIHASVLKRREQNSTSALAKNENSSSWLSYWNELNTGELDSLAPLIIKEELIAHQVLQDVPVDVVARIEAAPDQFPGVRFEILPKRVYPKGRFAAHVIGLRKPVTGKDAAIEKQGLQVQRFQVRSGQGGVEQSLNAELAARPGTKQITTDPHGDPLKEHMKSQPVPGCDVVLTIDSQLQQIAERALELVCDQQSPKLAGCLLLADMYSGELLVAADHPCPNLSLMASSSTQYWQEQLHDPRSPLFPRISHSQLPPGPLFAWVTYAAALEAGASPHSITLCQNDEQKSKSFVCQIGTDAATAHGRQTLEQAIGLQCVNAVASLAEQLGADSLTDFAIHCGFGIPTGIELPAEKSGSLPIQKLRDPQHKWTVRQTAELATGRNEVLITPLQWTQWLCLLGNRGEKIPLHLIRELHRSGQIHPLTSSAHRTQNRLSPSTAAHLLKAMKLAQQQTETSNNAPFVIQGLSGTGLPRGAHAWYGALFPAESPRYAVVVVIEHGKSLQLTAQPVAQEVIAAMKQYGWY